MRYPIFLNYEQNKPPVGWIELQDDLPKEVIQEGAIIPLLSKKNYEGNTEWKTTSFGLVPRTQVDTKPRKL